MRYDQAMEVLAGFAVLLAIGFMIYNELRLVLLARRERKRKP